MVLDIVFAVRKVVTIHALPLNVLYIDDPKKGLEERFSLTLKSMFTEL